MQTPLMTIILTIITQKNNANLYTKKMGVNEVFTPFHIRVI